jgi:ribosomal protein S18 acetylase RimI-like enzyme
MFADLALAARIERAEASLTTEIVSAIPDPRAFVTPIDDGVAAYARAGSPMNKLIGAGLSRALEDDALAEIEAAHASRDEPVRVELPTLAEPATLAGLIARGYRLRGFENVLGLSLAAAGAEPTDVAVEPVTAATDRGWRDALVHGFASPDGTGATIDQYAWDAIAQVMDDMARAPGLRRYVALVDGEIAGAASARIDHGILQLCGASTLPRFRRRGVQRALLGSRLVAGRADGCDLAVVTTAPGSQSQANVMRHGFALLYARAILCC